MDGVTRFLAGWAKDIIVVVGLAAVVEILLPRGDFRRFARLAMGLVVLLALTKPLLGLMQVPVVLPTATVQAQRSGSAFVWQEAAPGSGAVPAAGSVSLSGLVETQIAQLAASSLGLAAHDVRAHVQLAGKAAGWPGGIDSVRLTVLKVPAALLEQGEADSVDGRLDQVRQALLAQITSLYRLKPEQVQVIMPR